MCVCWLRAADSDLQARPRRDRMGVTASRQDGPGRGRRVRRSAEAKRVRARSLHGSQVLVPVCHRSTVHLPRESTCTCTCLAVQQPTAHSTWPVRTAARGATGATLRANRVAAIRRACPLNLFLASPARSLPLLHTSVPPPTSTLLLFWQPSSESLHAFGQRLLRSVLLFSSPPCTLPSPPCSRFGSLPVLLFRTPALHDTL